MGKRDHRRSGNILEKVEPQLERENHFCNTRGTLRNSSFRDDKIVLDSVTSTVVHGVPHRPVLSIPRSQERTVEPHLDGQVLQIHGSSATSRRFLQFLQTVRRPANKLPFVREFTEVILLQPRQAQRWIALGHRESRCTVACSAPIGGSLLHRVTSPSQERHRQTQLRVH